MFFLLDHDVDAAVGRMLRRHGHTCETAGAVGLATAADDDLTVWATSHRAVLISQDIEFMRRRMKNAIGHHLWLRCDAWDATDVLASHLDEIVARLSARPDLTIRASKDEDLADSSNWD